MSLINPGVISIFILLLVLILTTTDWLTPFAKYFGKKRIVTYLIASYIFFHISIPVTDSWTVNVGGYIFPAILYFIILFKRVRQDIFYVGSATVLIGASYFLFKELIRLDPIILFWDELYELTLFLLIIITVAASKLSHRSLLLVGGLIIGELLFNFRHSDSFTAITLGDEKFRDLFWFSLLSLVIFHYLIGLGKNLIKRLGIVNFAKMGDKN